MLPSTTSQTQVEARAIELQRLAQDAQNATDESALEASRLAEHERELTRELEACQAEAAQLRETQQSIQADATDVLGRAASEVRALSKQKLEEVRSLTSPSVVIQRALSLLYCLLHPAKALQQKHLEDISWKRTLSPMLKRDDLVHKLINFNSLGNAHPLLEYPAVAELIASHICEHEKNNTEGIEEPNINTTPRKRKSSSSSQNSIASRHAAQLLRVRSAQNLASSQTSSPGSSGGIVMQNRTDADFALARSDSKRFSVASALLADDGRLTVDAVEFASSAVGALFRWVVSQLSYARTMSNNSNHDVDDKLLRLCKEIEEIRTKESVAREAVEVAHQSSVAASIAAEEAKSKADVLREQATQASSEASDCRQRQASTLEISIVEGTAQIQTRSVQVRSCDEARQSVRAIARVPSQSQEEAFVEPEPQLESALENGDVAVSNIEVEIRERVTFARGSAEMSSFATRSIQGVLNVMNTNPDLKICVEGHSQNNEPASVSSKRANAVLEQLIKQGVPRHRLRQAGFGSAFPAEDGKTSARVEFSVIQEISIKGTVQFSPCSAELTHASGPLLDKVVALLVARPCLRVRVEGHTDNSPNWGCSNQELSQLRSENVVKLISNHGVDVDRLAPVGFGETLPRAENASRNGKAQNRRVEFHILQRETIQGLQELVTGKTRCREIDVHGLRQLERTATGAAVGLSRPIRVAAADLLVRLKADWPVQRLLMIAARLENPLTCPLARLPEDCAFRIFRLYFMLGCSSLQDISTCR